LFTGRLPLRRPRNRNKFFIQQFRQTLGVFLRTRLEMKISINKAART